MLSGFRRFCEELAHALVFFNLAHLPRQVAARWQPVLLSSFHNAAEDRACGARCQLAGGRDGSVCANWMA